MAGNDVGGITWTNQQLKGQGVSTQQTDNNFNLVNQKEVAKLDTWLKNNIPAGDLAAFQKWLDARLASGQPTTLDDVSQELTTLKLADTKGVGDQIAQDDMEGGRVLRAADAQTFAAGVMSGVQSENQGLQDFFGGNTQQGLSEYMAGAQQRNQNLAGIEILPQLDAAVDPNKSGPDVQAQQVAAWQAFQDPLALAFDPNALQAANQPLNQLATTIGQENGIDPNKYNGGQ